MFHTNPAIETHHFQEKPRWSVLNILTTNTIICYAGLCFVNVMKNVVNTVKGMCVYVQTVRQTSTNRADWLILLYGDFTSERNVLIMKRFLFFCHAHCTVQSIKCTYCFNKRNHVMW